MKRLLIVLALGGLLGAPLLAQEQGTTFVRSSFDKESLVVSTAAVTFTAATYAPTGSNRATLATFIVEGCAIRVWPTGTAPTSTVGQKLNVGDIGVVYGTHDIANFKAIRDTSCSSDATLQTVYAR